MQDHGMLYKEVVQMDIWVLTGAMLKVLEGFHYQESRQILGMTARHIEDGE